MPLATLTNLLILAVLIYIAVILTKFQHILKDKEEIEKNILTKLWHKLIGHKIKEREQEKDHTDYSGYCPYPQE